MKKILLVFFLALMTSLVFTECTCNNSKVAQAEQTDDLEEEEIEFEEEEDLSDSLEMEIDSIENEDGDEENES